MKTSPAWTTFFSYIQKRIYISMASIVIAVLAVHVSLRTFLLFLNISGTMVGSTGTSSLSFSGSICLRFSLQSTFYKVRIYDLAFAFISAIKPLKITSLILGSKIVLMKLSSICPSLSSVTHQVIFST